MTLRILIPISNLAPFLQNRHGDSQVSLIRNQNIGTRCADAQIAEGTHETAFHIGDTASLTGERVVRVARVDQLLVVRMTVIVSLGQGVGAPNAVDGAFGVPVLLAREAGNRGGGSSVHRLFSGFIFFEHACIESQVRCSGLSSMIGCGSLCEERCIGGHR